jgi:5'(3')-deoxyribonucleotidase
MNRKTIYFDMDNTLLDTFVGAIMFAQKKIFGGEYHKSTDIILSKPPDSLVHTYSTTAYLEAGGMTHNEAVLMRHYLFHSMEYWRTLPFQKDAYEVFKQIYEDHDVYIATSAFLSEADECILGKLRFIEEQLPWFDLKRLIYSHSKFKLTGDYFFEDVWSQIEDFNGTRVLVDQPYNRQANPDIRVYSWKEIHAIFYG